MKYSSPGKIHLLGEHSVVYGKPALLSAINLRVSVKITPTNKPPQLAEQTLELKNLIENILKKKYKVKIPQYNLEITKSLPLGSGLGSSAAVASAYFASLLEFLQIKFTTEEINELTYQTEKVFHGNPSGADNTTVVFGGLIYYRKELEDLKTFSSLPFKVHKNIKQFFLIHSGKPEETTKEMVEKVRIKKLESRIKVEQILNHQEQLTKEMVLALKEGNEEKLIEIIKKGEENLEKLGVVGKIAKQIIKQIEDLGGAAKISGAGGVKTGSGIILAYHPIPLTILEFIKQNNLESFNIKLTKIGLKKETA